MVDLRSDTVTKPSEAMRAAMHDAELGDDVYVEDPTVNALEAEVASLFGHEAALYVPSGTMGNQIGLRLCAEPGQELLCDSDAHIVTYEMAAPAALFGLSTRTVPGERGRLDVEAYAAQVRPVDWHVVQTAAIAVENTHNRGGGLVQPIEALRALRALADEQDLNLHCDGARIWNAHVASGVSLADYGLLFDTLSVCLSKGLGAPIGSVLVSTTERIAAARIWRKRLGGGMRQVGSLAAAGRFALVHNISRLSEDHARARRLASALAEFGVSDEAQVDTNIAVLDLAKTGGDGRAIAAAAAAEGVRISLVSPTRIRLVTHLDVDDDGIDRAIDVLRPLLAAL
ncbi:MAG: aminotransferase class I/II-fold pyridoxal phosphate-dependent enzyme [Geodermatophilaceae bacterium]|nr:aminotransferase class I/II-fold pyridoxal phosphate-dependent enzyme [Geodermatophilaceae bacterium]